LAGLAGPNDRAYKPAREQENYDMKNNSLSMERRAGLSCSGRWLQWLLFVCLVLVFSMPVLAEKGPVETLASMTATLEDLVKNDPDVINDPQRLRLIAHEVVLPNVDIRTLCRWVLGKNWRTATPEQRDAFVTEFQELLLSTYLRQVKTYQGEVARFLPLRGEQKEGQAVVNAEIEQPNGPVVHAIFRMRKAKQGWLIYDVSVEGISLVATHRSSFNREVRNGGLDKLISRLHDLNKRNAEDGVEVVTGSKVN
jgi:phospholipid transport system substrate-binding protein